MKNRIDFVNSDLEDLSCHTGVNFIVDLQLADYCSGLPDNLTGYTAQLIIYDDDDTDPIDTITGTISTPTNGQISFNIPAATTATYTAGMYHHHIQITISSTVYRIGQGYFEVSA